MTAAEWQALPELLTRAQVLDITGWGFKKYYGTLRDRPELAAPAVAPAHAMVRKHGLREYIEGEHPAAGT